MKRRQFFTIPAQALGGVLLYTLRGEPFLQAQNTESVKVPLRFFSEPEARIISAACARIFPSDESGPGATEAGVIIYIDRQLAGPYGRDRFRYSKGPFFESVPEHGHQGPDTPRDVYRKGIQTLGADFAAISIDDQNQRLRAIENGVFFHMLRSHTIEGMFCDPMHGGNAGLIGWQLLGFPGPQMSYREHIDKHYGEAYRPKPISLEQAVGHPVRPWEDEDAIH